MVIARPQCEQVINPDSGYSSATPGTSGLINLLLGCDFLLLAFSLASRALSLRTARSFWTASQVCSSTSASQKSDLVTTSSSAFRCKMRTSSTMSATYSPQTNVP